MKNGIHPSYQQTEVACACGKNFTVGSTMNKTIKVEVCFNCHPFYTGKQKLIDSAGRVDSFRRRTEIAKEIELLKKKSAKKKHMTDEAEEEETSSVLSEETAAVEEIETENTSEAETSEEVTAAKKEKKPAAAKAKKAPAKKKA